MSFGRFLHAYMCQYKNLNILFSVGKKNQLNVLEVFLLIPQHRRTSSYNTTLPASVCKIFLVRLQSRWTGRRSMTWKTSRASRNGWTSPRVTSCRWRRWPGLWRAARSGWWGSPTLPRQDLRRRSGSREASISAWVWSQSRWWRLASAFIYLFIYLFFILFVHAFIYCKLLLTVVLSIFLSCEYRIRYQCI